MIRSMKRHFQFAGLLLALAISVPMFAQRGTNASIAPPASLMTGGTRMAPAAPSITSQSFGRTNHGGSPHGGNWGGNYSRSFVPRHDRDHGHDRGYRNRYNGYYGGYYYYPSYYGGYGWPVYFDNYSDLPGAGTFDTGQNYEDYEPDPRPRDYFYRPQAGVNSLLESERYGDHYTDNREAAPPEAHGVVTTNGNENNDAMTVLIFKDGVRREVTNYAIMGQYVFVFSGDRRKIPLSEIDIDATQKANEERGIQFKVPGSAKAS